MQDNSPVVLDEQKAKVFQKLEPYLKMGLSLSKACLESGTPRSTVYDWMDKDSAFLDKIKQSQQYLSIITSSAIVTHLHSIVRKLNPGKDEKGAEKILVPLTATDIDFLKWYALNSNTTKEEFGERKDIGLVDPEVEIKKLAGMIDEMTGGKKKSDEEAVKTTPETPIE